MLRHEPPRGHAEHPGRLQAVLEALEGAQSARAPYASTRPSRACIPFATLTRSNPRSPKPKPRASSSIRYFYLGRFARSHLSRRGACVAAVDAVLGGEDDMAFCAVRPPGHHAEPISPMGFCIFNNVAIGALHALEAHGLARVAVVDFDVHHGNGTQTIAESEPRLMFASTHQAPLYPGTGAHSETGIGGNVVNAPLSAGAGSQEWRNAMEARVLPRSHSLPN